MKLSESVLHEGLAAGGWVVSVALLGFALARAARHDRALVASGPVQNAMLGGAVMLALIQSMSVSPVPGVGLHLSGAGLAAAMFGWRLALPVLAAAMALCRLLGPGASLSAAGFGIDFLLGAALPALVAAGLHEAMRRMLPRHPMIFVFGHGFLAAGAGFALAAASGALLLAAAGTVARDVAIGELLPYALLLSWAEAFISGILLAIFVVYRPGWVPTFDDRVYLTPN